MTYREAVNYYTHNQRFGVGGLADEMWLAVVDAILTRLNHVEDSNSVLRDRLVDAADTNLTDCYDIVEN